MNLVAKWEAPSGDCSVQIEIKPNFVARILGCEALNPLVDNRIGCDHFEPVED